MPLRESIRALRARAKELKLRTKAHLGDYEAREKIKALEEFKRRHGIDKLSPEAYDLELKHFKSRLEFIASQKQQLEEIEKRMEERGIELTPYQRKLLSDLKRIAGKDPWATWQLLGAVQTADAWRTEIAKSIKAAERTKGSSWSTYLLMLTPKTPVRKRYLDIYRDARLFGLPKRMIGRLMRTFEEDYSGKLAKSLLPSIAIANSDYVKRIAKTRTIQSARYDFKKSAELAELLAAMAEITSGRKILGEIVGHAVGSYDRSREGDAAKLWQYIQEHAKEIYGKEIEDVTIRGRHHERIEKIESAKKAAVETLKKYLEDIDSKIEEKKKVLERYKNDPDRKKIIEGQIKALEKKRSEAMRAAAREILLNIMGEKTKIGTSTIARKARQRKADGSRAEWRTTAATVIRRERSKRKLYEAIIKEFAREYGEENAMKALAIMTKRAGRRKMEANNLEEFFKRMDRAAAQSIRNYQAMEEAGAFFGRWDSTMDVRKALLNARDAQIRKVANLMWRYGFVVNPSTGKMSEEAELEMLRKMGALRKHNASDILLQRFLRLARNISARTPGAQGVPRTMVRKQVAMSEILREIDKIRKIENALKEIERKNFE